MTNKYLEKIAAQGEYTDKMHARRHMFGVFGLASKKLRDRETTVGGFLRTQGRGAVEGTAGALVGSLAGGAIGHKLFKGSPAAVFGGATLGQTIGALGGLYHGELASIRNRIAAGKLKNTKDTSK